MAKSNINTDANIPEMDLDKNYSPKKFAVPEAPTSEKDKSGDKIKKELDKLKGYILKKYPFTKAISILPPQSIKDFIEEETENLNKEQIEKLQKKVHLNIIIPDEKVKDIYKIKKDIIEQIEKSKQEIWIYMRTPSEIWEICTDQKFELYAAMAMSFPLHDKGILGAMRVTEIHKSLVLQKFEKYVVSYVLGGSLIRGEASKDSDVDVFVIINDTDVKRMPRLELKERLRGIIYQYVGEASALAGVNNKLEPQIYLLTDFWEAVKDAHPVMFTFIRDGVPIYDRGTFMPWKALLKMGKLKPSPEAIDMFMSMGDGVIPRSKRTLLSDIFVNIFWGITTPAQALLMLNGCPPPNAKKELVRDFKREFLDTKMIEKKYIDFMEKVINIWRDYEHEKIKEISGTEIDKLLKETEGFLKRLKELRTQIDKKAQEKIIEKIYSDTINLLSAIFGKKSQQQLVLEFEKNLVKKGKMTQQHLRILKNIIAARTEFKKGKLDAHKVDNARKEASTLINDLIEFSQRRDMALLEKRRMKIKFKQGSGELLLSGENAFLFRQNKVFKITSKLEDSNMEEVSKSREDQKNKKDVGFNSKVFDVLKKELGEFEVIL
ncbi:MAG TPA: nucleotidyltransferase domain-containing protein [Candidatus Pacearchaeota archaeon]|nr:nucleotidyltransferase domain-containing protein [Candidatus Pacearchaeota archaeon]HPX74573.1 nucleotidyltransferase domain-containing protein [Candidatus Pacearchaeota archaeon]HQC60987.1 nucleotidyltransferase domain-containing protein [Candidatus Pacearchaeota archaeon]